MAIHKNYCVQIHVDGGSAVNVPDITSFSIPNNPTIDQITTAGEISPTIVHLIENNAEMDFATFALEAVLDAIGVSGTCILTTTNPGITGYLQKYNDCGTPVTSNTHFSYLIQAGIIYPKTLTVEHGGSASLTVGVAVTKSGSEELVETSNAATLPTINIDSIRWTLGDITLGGITFSDYTSLTIDFGNEIQKRGTQSEIDAQYIEQREHKPRITISGIDPEWYDGDGTPATVPPAGLVCTHANSSIYLRKRADGGNGFVADGTAEHIKFTVDGLAMAENIVAGSDSQRATEHSVTVTCRKNTSGQSPIIYTPTTAIT